MLTGVGGNNLHTNLLHADSAISKSVGRISSGKRINRASEDPAGNAMLSAFDSQSRALAQMMSNQQSQASVLQTASSSLTTTSNILQGINSLALQASNGTLTESDRAMIQQQINQLSTQINMSANQTQYNGQNLLDGSFSTTLQNGEKFAIDSMTASALGLNNLSVATPQEAMSASDLAKSALSNADNDKHVGVLFDFFSRSLDACEFLFIVVGGQIQPADKIVAQTGAVMQSSMRRLDLFGHPLIFLLADKTL